MESYPREDTTSFAKRAWIGPGGAATNYAVAVARLGQRAILVARAGDDLVRLGILEELRRMGVDTGYVYVAKGEPPGIVVVIVSPSGSSRTMITVRGANEGLTGSMVPSLGDVVHFASVRGRVVLEAAEAVRGRLVSYDPGGEVYRRPTEIIRALESGLIKTFYANEKEIQALTERTGRTIEDFLAGGVDAVVVKKGRGGAKAYSRTGVYEVDPPRIPEPLDVTGAGDAFDAAFNTCTLIGCGLEESLRFAVAAGTAKVLRRGSSNMPGLEDIIGIAE